MGRRFNSTLAVVATVAGSLALVRLADAVGKRELVRVSRELEAEAESVTVRYDSLKQIAERFQQDQEFLNYRIASLSKREPYLVVSRVERKLALAVQDKTIMETGFHMRSLNPNDGIFDVLPKATLEVLARQERTDWVRPDWLYKLEGIPPPPDSERIVKNAFGPGEVFLGGELEIHGPVSESVPAEAVDHNYIELDSIALKRVVEAVKPGTLVLIK
jgi:hypothetical protein